MSVVYLLICHSFIYAFIYGLVNLVHELALNVLFFRIINATKVLFLSLLTRHPNLSFSFPKDHQQYQLIRLTVLIIRLQWNILGQFEKKTRGSLSSKE